MPHSADRRRTGEEARASAVDEAQLGIAMIACMLRRVDAAQVGLQVGEGAGLEGDSRGGQGPANGKPSSGPDR